MDLENPLDSPLTALLAASAPLATFCPGNDKTGPSAPAAVPQQQYNNKELPALSCQAVQGSSSEVPSMPRRTLVLDLSQVPGEPNILRVDDAPATATGGARVPAASSAAAADAVPIPAAADTAVPGPTLITTVAAAVSPDCCAGQHHQQQQQHQQPLAGNNNRAASPQFAQAVKTTKDLSVVKAEAHMHDRELVDLFCHWTTDGFDTPDFQVLTASREVEVRALLPCPASAAAGAEGQVLLQPQHTAELLFTGKPELQLPMLQVPQRSVPLLLDLRSPAASDGMGHPVFPPVEGFLPNQQLQPQQQQQQQQAPWAGVPVQRPATSTAMNTTIQQPAQQQQATPQDSAHAVTQVGANPAEVTHSDQGPDMTPAATTVPQLFAPLADLLGSPVICGVSQGNGGDLLLASPLVALPGTAGMRFISLSPAAVPPVSPDTQITLLTDQKAAYLHIESDQQNRELLGSCFNCQSGRLVVGPVCGTSIGPVCGPACAPVFTAAAAAVSGPSSNHASEILLDPSVEDSLDVCEWLEGSSTAANPLVGSTTGSTPIGASATGASDAQLDASGTELAVPTAAAAAAALTATLSVQNFIDIQAGSTAGAAAVQLQYQQAVPQSSGFQTWQGAAQYDQVYLQHQQQQQQQVQMQPSPECLMPFAYQPGMQQQQQHYQQQFGGTARYPSASLPTVPSITPPWGAAAPATVNAFANSYCDNNSGLMRQSFSGFMPQQATGTLQLESSWVPTSDGAVGTAGAAAEPAAAAGGYYAAPQSGFGQGGLDVYDAAYNSGHFGGQQYRAGTAYNSTDGGTGSTAGGSTGGRASKGKGQGKASKGSSSKGAGTSSFHQKRKAAALAAAGAAAFGAAYPVGNAAAASSGSIAAGRPQRKAAQLGLEKIHAYCQDTYKDLVEDPLAERLPVPEQYSRHKQQQQLGSATAPWLSATAAASSSAALFDASYGPSGLPGTVTATAGGSAVGQATSSNGMYPFTAYSDNSLLSQIVLGQLQNGCQLTGSPVLPGAQQYNEFGQARTSMGGAIIVPPAGRTASTPAVNNNAGQAYGAVHSTAAASLSGGGLSAGLSAGGSSNGGVSGGGGGMQAVQLQDKQYRVSDHARANNSGVQGILDLSDSPMQQAGKAAAAAAAAAEAACAVKQYVAEGVGGVGLSVPAAAAAAAAPVLCSRDVLLMVFAAKQNQATTVSAVTASTLCNGAAHIVAAAAAAPSVPALAAAAATADAAVAVMGAVRRSERRRQCAGVEPLTEPQAALVLPAAATAAAGVPSIAVARPAVAAEGTGMLQADGGSPASAAALPDDHSGPVTLPKGLSVPAVVPTVPSVVPQANGSNLRVRLRGAKRRQQPLVGEASDKVAASPVKRLKPTGD